MQDVIGALILTVNAAMLAAFALLLGRRLWPAVRKLAGRCIPARWRGGTGWLLADAKQSAPGATA